MPALPPHRSALDVAGAANPASLGVAVVMPAWLIADALNQEGGLGPESMRHCARPVIRII